VAAFRASRSDVAADHVPVVDDRRLLDVEVPLRQPRLELIGDAAIGGQGAIAVRVASLLLGLDGRPPGGDAVLLALAIKVVPAYGRCTLCTDAMCSFARKCKTADDASR
jgi:hypothetical protein